MPLTQAEKAKELAKEKHKIWLDNWARTEKLIRPHLRSDGNGGFFLDTSTCPSLLERKFKKLVTQGVQRGYLTMEEEPSNPAVNTEGISND